MKLYKKFYKIVNNTNSSINKSKSHIIKITIIKVAITIIMTTKSHMETTVKIYELHKDCKLHRISTAKPVCAIFKKSDQKKYKLATHSAMLPMRSLQIAFARRTRNDEKKKLFLNILTC